MAILDMYNPMASRGYSMPPALGGYDLTPAALAQSPAGPQPRPALVHPKPHMQSAIANDPLLQLMAGGNKQRLGPQETLNFYTGLDPAEQKQHAARIDGSHTAALEMRDAMGPPPQYGNLDGTVYGTGSDTPVLESADPIDDLQEREIARLQEAERMKLINNPLGGTGGALTDTSEILDLITKTDNFGLPNRSGSNRLTNLLSGLSRDGIDFAKAVIENGISVTYNGNEIFATDGQGNTSRVDEETAAKIGAANSGGGPAVPVSEQLTNPPIGMSFNPPVPALTSPSTETGNGTTGNGGTGPVLRQPTSNTARNGNAARRMTGGYTGNARGSGLPDMQIGLGERLMRMGAAGLAAGAQGPLAQMGAMTGAYNDVNQANRQAEMGTFKIEEERRQAHANRVAKLAAAKAKSGGDMDKLKDFQAKNFGFYNRGVEAEQALMDTAGMGTDLWEKLKSNVPLFGNALVDPKYQRYDQARRNFVNAVLRRESGAVISDAEFENANIQYFPQFGDTEETLSQKQRNRQTTMEGIRMGAGPSIFYTPAYPMGVPTDQGGGAPDQETEDLVKKYSQ